MNIILLGDPAQGGFRGYNSCGSNNDLAWGQSPLCYNYMVSNTGLEKRKGCAKDNATEIGSGTGATGLHRFFDGTNRKTFMKIGATVYEVAASGASISRLGSLGATTEVEFADWASSCFVVDGVTLNRATTAGFSAVTWLDEDGAATDGTHPSGAWTLKPTPATLVLHKEHLWWFDLNSSRVGFTVRDYYDRIYENTVSAGNYGSWVACDADDGQYLKALVRLPMADCLMAFKERKSFFIEGDFDSTSDTLNVRPGPPMGAYAQKGVVVRPDGFVSWFGPDGIWQYRQDTGPICLSYNKQLGLDVKAELEQIAAANRAKCCMGYDPERQLLLFFYPYGSATYNDRGMAFDTVKMEWMPIRSWNVARVVAYEDGTVHAGWSNAGYVKKLFTGNSDDGTAISCYYETKFYGAPQIEMVLDSIRGRVTAGRTLTFGWRSDPGTNVSGSATFAYGTAPILLGDRDHPAASGTFTLGDEDSAGSGTVLSDRDARVIADFARRVAAGQKFREMKFIFQESSSQAHSLDFIEARTYPRRRVV